MKQPANDTLHDLSLFARKQSTIRDKCQKEDYPEDGFNPKDNQVSDTLINAISEFNQT